LANAIMAGETILQWGETEFRAARSQAETWKCYGGEGV
jgi:hypothetical protein